MVPSLAANEACCTVAALVHVVGFEFRIAGALAAAAAAGVNEIPRESTAIATMDIEAKMPVRTVWPPRAPRYPGARAPHATLGRHMCMHVFMCNPFPPSPPP